MTSLATTFKELKNLKGDLNASVNCLWELRMARLEASRRGHHDGDFLPRRLKNLSLTEEGRFESLLQQVRLILDHQLDQQFFVLTSKRDLYTLLNIRKTVRYIRNAFSNATPVSHTLGKLNSALPQS